MNLFKRFVYEEDGMETIQVAIIIAIGVALAIALRSQISTMWGSVTGQMDRVNEALEDF